MRTSYFRAVTVLVAMAAATVVTVLMGYGFASAQDGDGEPELTNPGQPCPPDEPDCAVEAPPSGTPAVISTSPKDGATNVDRDANIKAKFSEKMMKSSINGGTVSVEEAVFNPSEPDPLLYTVKYNAKKKLAILNPSERLQPNTEYEVTIEGAPDPAVKDRAGNAMTADYTWTFTTEGDGCNISC